VLTVTVNYAIVEELKSILGPSIQPPLGGSIIGDNYADLAASITFGCNPGLRLIGSNTTTCVHSGNGINWDYPPPACLGLYSV